MDYEKIEELVKNEELVKEIKNLKYE